MVRLDNLDVHQNVRISTLNLFLSFMYFIWVCLHEFSASHMPTEARSLGTGVAGRCELQTIERPVF